MRGFAGGDGVGVAPANFYGGVQATQQLIAAGHRHLLHIREQNRWTTKQREYGFMNAVAGTSGATGEILDGRRDHPARPAPRRPEIHDDRDL